jgi:hypothetical protein
MQAIAVRVRIFDLITCLDGPITACMGKMVAVLFLLDKIRRPE